MESQVLVLQTLNSNLVLGPENVSGFDSLVCQNHIVDIKLVHDELQTKRTNFTHELAGLKKKKKIKAVNAKINDLDAELKWLDKIKQLWLYELKQFEFYRLWSENNCYKIISNIGELSPDEYVLEIENDSSILNMKFFKVTTVKGEEYWDKIRKEGCTTENKECFIWCLKVGPNTFHLIDIQRKGIGFSQLNEDFKYSSQNKQFEKILKMPNHNTNIIKIISKENGEIIQVQDWELMDCN